MPGWRCSPCRNKPELGSIALGTLPLPGFALDFASMFRASGRMVWPAGYLLTALAFVLLQRRLGDRALVTLASLAVVLQIVDSSDRWQRFAATQPATAQAWVSPLHSPFWTLAASRYTRIRAIPPDPLTPAWVDLAYFAAFHHLGTDAAYLGRRDARGAAQLTALADAALTNGSFDPQTIYVLDPASAAEAARFVGPGDLLAPVDGLIVFARGGASLLDAVTTQPTAAPPPPRREAAPCAGRG